MRNMTVEEVAPAIASSTPHLDRDQRRLALAAYRLLARGEPVGSGVLADVTHLDTGWVKETLESWPAVNWDDGGRIVGFGGLALAQTPHRLEIAGRQLYGWCALDALFLPGLIGATARVTSACPVTGEGVALTVTPDGVEELSHTDAVVSLLPSVGADFCDHVNFFASPQAGTEGTADRDDAFLLPVHEAFRLAKLSNPL
ncbi:MAG: organomercurial lyase, partial [Dehalococcoidia bacterium]